jgi:hypothetical protein
VKGQNDRLSLETSDASEFHPIDRKGHAVWIHRILFSFYPVHRVILSKKEFTAPQPLNAYGCQPVKVAVWRGSMESAGVEFQHHDLGWTKEPQAMRAGIKRAPAPLV